MATYVDLCNKFPEMKTAVEAKGGTVTVANTNPSPDEIISGIDTIKAVTWDDTCFLQEVPSDIPSGKVLADMGGVDLHDGLRIVYSSGANGLWLLDKNTKTYTQVYTKGTNWSFVQKVGEKYLVTGTGNYGILLLDTSTKTASQVWSSGQYRERYQLIGNKCIITGSSFSGSTGFLLYDIQTETISNIWPTGSYGRCTKVTDTKVLLSGMDIGLLLYDDSTETVTELIPSTEYKQFTTFTQAGRKWLISTASADSPGLWTYDSETDEVTQIHNAGKSWGNTSNTVGCVSVVGDKYLLTPYDRTTKGVAIYDTTTNTCSTILDTVSGCVLSEAINGKCLIGTYDFASAGGLWVYDGTTGVISQIRDEARWCGFISVGSKWFVSNGNSSTPGMWSYDSENDTFTQISTSGYYWAPLDSITNTRSVRFGTKYLICSKSTSVSGILVYDSVTEQIATKNTNVKGVTSFYVTKDACLSIGYDYNSSAIVLYDGTTDTFTIFRRSDSAFKNLSIKGCENGNIYVYGLTSGSNDSGYTVIKYDASTKTLRTSHLGVVLS